MRKRNQIVRGQSHDLHHIAYSRIWVPLFSHAGAARDVGTPALWKPLGSKLYEETFVTVYNYFRKK